jgi:hypothetical protein
MAAFAITLLNWNDGIMGSSRGISVLPTFHHSNIPLLQPDGFGVSRSGKLLTGHPYAIDVPRS